MPGRTSLTVAVTGATGFAGRHAVSALLERGLRVKALVRSPAKAGLPEVVETVTGDLGDRAALARLAEAADCVIHLAGAIAAVDRESFFRVNAEGSAAMAEVAAESSVKRFVHVSSLAARQPELSAYGASKRAGEEAVLQHRERMQVLVLRPPAIYGPSDRATLPLLKMLTSRVAVIPGRKDARISLIHVGDVARLLADAVENGMTGIHEASDGRSGGYGWEDLLRIASRTVGHEVRPVFLPKSLPQAVGALAETFSRLSGKPGMVTRGKVAELYHPDWVAREALTAENAITFETGFPSTLAWYREAGWLPGASSAKTSSSPSHHEARR